MIAFKPCYRVHCIEPDMAFLLAEKKCFLLRGRLYCLLAPLLEEPLYSREELLERWEGQVPPEQLHYALNRLEKGGFIEETDRCIPAEASAFYHSLGVAPKEAKRRLESARVFVHSCASFDREPFSSILESLGIKETKDVETADLSLLFVDDYLQGEIEAFNRRALQRNSSWLLAKPRGHELWIGPLIQPGKTGCSSCLSFRLRKNRLEESFIRKKKERSELPFNSRSLLPSSLTAAFHLTALELLKALLLQQNAPLLGKMLSFDMAASSLQEHILTKRPQCPCCGDPTAGREAWTRPISPESLAKTGYDDNGVRLALPQQTLDAYAHHISPITGLVKELTRIDLLPSSVIHLYTAGHNFALCNDTSGIFRNNLRETSGGKGRSDLQAKASALCEAIERYCGLFEGNEITKRASHRSMGSSAIHPSRCLLFSDKQLQNRHESSRSAHSFHTVFEPLDENTPIDWTPVWSLSEKRQRFLPTAYCYFGYRPNGFFCRADSNGNASGNCLEEAILHGLYELIERDSAAIWWYNRLPKPQLDLSSFQDPFFDRLLRDYRQMGREVWALDLTADLQIPAFVALTAKPGQAQQQIVFGFGCDLNARIAIGRALTEMNQLLSVLPKNLTDLPAQDNQDAIDERIVKDWLLHKTVENQTYLQGRGPKKCASDYPERPFGDLASEIRFCQSVLELNGLELLVLNQTRPDIGLNVAKVIVPGLRHFWPRFAPGRLYDVPVKLGWQTKPTPEEELNPIAIFI